MTDDNQIPLPAGGFESKSIRRRHSVPPQYDLPPHCIEFYKDDEGFRAWLSANPNGYVMNNYQRDNGPIPAFRQPENAMTIHHVTEGAGHLARSDTMSYRKLCCKERKPLDDFKRTVFAALNLSMGTTT
ncbi:MAG: hypothetical protein OXI13_14070 [Gammaproteobacteria bacterium]|nr:hypothetical protein [Gammaproteobacteria bacterium]MDE0480739.1 hypothetical protein [Gammaproteobacteria bacterium]MXX05529.1 hypothetical protein [Gammaproteobacteria bacterium]MYE30345.1 hypothetical protein [Gammaproteobacteria bacterium]MYI02979.1 hypothetical protein [Gammaproteobacteria bacterium]